MEQTAIVIAKQETVDTLSEQLWCVGELDFVAHAKDTDSEVQRRFSPIWLCEDLDTVTQSLGDFTMSNRYKVLVNLLPDVAQGFERFERLIELVDNDEANTLQARNRLRYYKERGYPIRFYDYSKKT
jgi:DNA polymerase-3 subunit chi